MFPGCLWCEYAQNMHSHVSMCLLIHPQMKLEMFPDECVCVCVCARLCVWVKALPVQSVEREAPSCEAEAACQCCPPGTGTLAASGLLNKLLGWAGSHTSRGKGREGGERGETSKRGGGKDSRQLGIYCQRSDASPGLWLVMVQNGQRSFSIYWVQIKVICLKGLFLMKSWPWSYQCDCEKKSRKNSLLCILQYKSKYSVDVCVQ